MAKGFNGGIIGTRNLTTGGGIGQGTAVGIWSMNEAQIAKLAGLWPQEIGSGQIIPGFERALIGKNIGDKITVEIEPELGYGLVNEELIAKIPKERVPEGVHVGQELQSVLENGQPITVLITEVNNDDVVIDANHPLAGKDLIFDIEIVSLG